MKKYLGILFFVCHFNIEAQGSFPLQKGNIWQYKSQNIPHQDIDLEAKALGDTLFSNGKNYTLLSGNLFGTNFFRQEGSKVYGYDKVDSSEYVLLDYSANFNDTLSRHSKGQRTVVAGGKILIPENNHPSWLFYERAGTGPVSYVFYSWMIEDSIGLTSITIEPGNSWRLSGAIINGKLIGTITGISKENNILSQKF